MIFVNQIFWLTIFALMILALANFLRVIFVLLFSLNRLALNRFGLSSFGTRKVGGNTGRFLWRALCNRNVSNRTLVALRFDRRSGFMYSLSHRFGSLHRRSLYRGWFRS